MQKPETVTVTETETETVPRLVDWHRPIQMNYEMAGTTCIFWPLTYRYTHTYTHTYTMGQAHLFIIPQAFDQRLTPKN